MKINIKALIVYLLMATSFSSLFGSRAARPMLGAVQSQQSIALGSLRVLYNDPKVLKEFIDSIGQLTREEAKDLYINLKVIFEAIRAKPKKYVLDLSKIDQTLSQENYVAKAIVYLNQLFTLKSTGKAAIQENDLADGVTNLNQQQVEDLNKMLKPIKDRPQNVFKPTAVQMQKQPAASADAKARMSQTAAAKPAARSLRAQAGQAQVQYTGAEGAAAATPQASAKPVVRKPSAALTANPQYKEPSEAQLGARRVSSSAHQMTPSAQAALMRQRLGAKPAAPTRGVDVQSAAGARNVRSQSQVVRQLATEVQKVSALKPSFTVNPKDLLPVPAEFVGKVMYIKVAQQGIDECGFRVAANAKAVDELLNQRLQLSTAAINIKAQAHLKTCGIRQVKIGPDEVVIAAQKLKLTNFYIGEARLKEQKIAIYKGPEYDPKGELIMSILRNLNEEARASFFVNYSDHWVNAVVIKERGLKPVIIYMNSQNSPLTKEGKAYQALSLLLNEIESPVTATASAAQQLSADAKEYAQNQSAAGQQLQNPPAASAPLSEAPPKSAEETQYELDAKKENDLLAELNTLYKDLSKTRSNFYKSINSFDFKTAYELLDHFRTKLKRYQEIVDENFKFVASNHFAPGSDNQFSDWGARNGGFEYDLIKEMEPALKKRMGETYFWEKHYEKRMFELSKKIESAKSFGAPIRGIQSSVSLFEILVQELELLKNIRGSQFKTDDFIFIPGQLQVLEFDLDPKTEYETGYGNEKVPAAELDALRNRLDAVRTVLRNLGFTVYDTTPWIKQKAENK